MFLALLGQAYPGYVSCYLNYGQIHVDLYKSDFTPIIRSRGTSYSEKGGAMMIIYKKTKQTNVFIDVRFTTGQGANYLTVSNVGALVDRGGGGPEFFSHGENLEPKVVFPRAGENPINVHVTCPFSQENSLTRACFCENTIKAWEGLCYITGLKKTQTNQ